jgi:cobalt-zinc-cadmium efflux system outer membrane protein
MNCIFYRGLSFYFLKLFLLLIIFSTFATAQTPTSNINQLIEKALVNNGELIAFRLDIERARTRIKQASLHPNPSFDFQYTTGKLTNTVGESTTSAGFSLPIELGGKRQRRIDLAQAELNVIEMVVADKERRLANEVRTVYSEILAAMRELEITQRLTDLDIKTSQIVEVRVKEGDAAPLEMNLLAVELERLKSRRMLIEGRLQAVTLRLKSIVGLSIDEPIVFEQELIKPVANRVPKLADLVEIALQTRPDLKAIRLEEEVAKASLRLAKTQVMPDLTLSTTYSRQSSSFDETSIGAIFDKDTLVTFGASINLPIFNRNQGVQAETSISIAQAQRRREFLEQLVKTEVTTAYTRFITVQNASNNFEQGVINSSTNNLHIFREIYNLGEFKITDLITEQRRLVDSEREYTEILAEKYRAWSDLQSAIGLMTTIGGN